MKVTFLPHVGVHTDSGRLVEHDQYIVMVEGVQAGYVCKSPGSTVNFIRRVTSQELVSVVDAVKRDLGWDSPTSQPDEIPEAVLRQLRQQNGQDVDEDEDE